MPSPASRRHLFELVNKRKFLAILEQRLIVLATELDSEQREVLARVGLPADI
ncbi:hypothetical protein [Mesorhizobium sp. M0013]|uniref:hypothetical protein n=1 Tax=Mesorhizobium sp. M0013 TaxID=2956841 RepID=UPI0033374513